MNVAWGCWTLSAPSLRTSKEDLRGQSPKKVFRVFVFGTVLGTVLQVQEPNDLLATFFNVMVQFTSSTCACRMKSVAQHKKYKKTKYKNHLNQGDLYIPASNYMFKVDNRSTRARCEICS